MWAYGALLSKELNCYPRGPTPCVTKLPAKTWWAGSCEFFLLLLSTMGALFLLSFISFFLSQHSIYISLSILQKRAGERRDNLQGAHIYNEWLELNHECDPRLSICHKLEWDLHPNLWTLGFQDSFCMIPGFCYYKSMIVILIQIHWEILSKLNIWNRTHIQA